MNDDGANVVRVSFEGGNLLGSVVIVYSQLEVIRTANNPVLAGNEAARPYWDICKLKGLDYCLCLERPDVGMATV